MFLHWVSQHKKITLLFSFLSVCAATLISSFIFINWLVYNSTKSSIFPPDQLPHTYQTGILLGAKVYANGGLSGMTKDRADTAIKLYQQQKIKKILISGDHGTKEYDEVNTIKDYLLKNNIPQQDIFLDHAGFDTYDSVYRAKEIFQVESVVIISQAFHVPRGVYIAQQLNIPVAGVPADIQNYGHMERVLIREKIATIKAWLDIQLHSQPTFLGEPIPITGDSTKSWDTL